MAGILLPYQKRWVEDRTRFKVWLAARQIGKSFGASLETTLHSLEKKATWVYLSVGERQSLELANKTAMHLEAISGAAETIDSSFAMSDDVKVRKTEILLPNGSRHIFLPANPDTARGYSANVFLDEFAFHKDSQKIWAALFPTITRRRDLLLRIASTPNGKSNKFHEIWGGKDERMSKRQTWARHRTDIYDAVAAGLDIDLEELKVGLSDDFAWQQEYLLEFLEDNTAYLSYELISSCESWEATLAAVPEMLDGRNTYLGVDIGRHRDLTVMWLIEKVGDVYWTRAVIEMAGATFSEQREQLYQLIPNVQRCAIDATGLGMQLAEEAKEKFGAKVEPVTFTNQSKNDLATTTRRTFEDAKVRIPVDKEIRADLHSVQRSITSAGNVRYDADRRGGGHADRFWALALSLHATDSGTYGVPTGARAKTPTRTMVGERGRF